MPRVKDLSHLRPGARIHLMGICGVAMGNFAGLLKAKGYKVTGSDKNPFPPMSTQLEALKIPVMPGYVAENLAHPIDIVVVGNVIRKSFDEVQELLRLDLPYISFPEALHHLVLKKGDTVVVTGTHGKTTTSSMMVSVMESVLGAGQGGFLVGGVGAQNRPSFQSGPKGCFILEGDEYDTAFFEKTPKFLHYGGKYVIFSNVEFDHADIYQNLDQIKAAFKALLESLPKEGIVIAGTDDQGVREVLSEASISARVKTFGASSKASSCDYSFHSRKVSKEGSFLKISIPTGEEVSLQIPAFGIYNAYNAVAAVAMALEMGWPLQKTVSGLASFQGVKRRQEIIGCLNGAPVVEDFAHHPTSVGLTLEGVRERWPNRPLWVLFEPRSATAKRNIFHHSYKKVFASLTKQDKVFLRFPINVDLIPKEERFDISLLAQELEPLGVSAQGVSDMDELAQRLKQEVTLEDVVVIMSNGDFGGLYEKLLS